MTPASLRGALPFLLFFTLLQPHALSASAADNQDTALTGIWKGTLTQDSGGCYPRYFLELQIDASGDRIRGNAYDYYDKEHFVKMSFTGRYNTLTHRLMLIENNVLQENIPADCAPCIKTYDLSYTRNGAEEILKGDWKGLLSGKHTACPPGKVSLKKTTRPDFPVDILQNDTLATLQQSLHLAPRETSLVKTITVNTPHIKIELYDNGEIDHDTVTVLVNGKLLLYRQMLTDKPLTVYLDAFPNNLYELVMYADNLGTIPPNTALMMVTAGSRKIEVFLSSSEEKSASVRLLYQPE